MPMKKITLVILLSILFSTGYAQRMKTITQGNLKPLKSEKYIKISFSYDNMLIGSDGLSEESYIKRKKDDYNEKESGKGDQWERAWFSDRQERFEPKFIELFEKYGKMSTKGEGKYMLIFKTRRTEPGWNVGVMRSSARIDGEAWVIEVANPENIIAKIKMFNVPGSAAYDFDTGYRIQEAYAKSAKVIGKIITNF
jgi:hypothetical protein